MLTRKCAECGLEMPLDIDNSTEIVLYKKKYYHKECFVRLCENKLSSNRTRNKETWQKALVEIDDFCNATRDEMITAIAKDDIYRFIISHYQLSCVTDRFFTKLDSIYTGTYKGLAYPIGPRELLDEWQFYWELLLSNRRFKDMSNEQALAYDIATLLSLNADYRREVAQKNMEKEVISAQKNVVDEIDVSRIANVQRGKRKLCDVYDDWSGGD